MKKFSPLAGLLFCSIPIIAVVLQLGMYGEPPESAITLSYLPVWVLFLAGGLSGNAGGALAGLLIGGTMTLGIWFAVGLIANLAAVLLSKKYRLTFLWIFYALTLFFAVLLPSMMYESDRIEESAIEETWETCGQKATPEAIENCREKVRPRMNQENADWVRDHLAKEAISYCNQQIDEKFQTSCWGAVGMFHPGSAARCASATAQSAKSMCYFQAAEQLSDPKLCTKIPDADMQERCKDRVEITRDYFTAQRAKNGIRD
jgi:hypothetical protein